jgi:branched-chain amino acid transport system substrate-binding protein
MKTLSMLIVMACFVALPVHADIALGLAGPTTGPNTTLGDQPRRGAERAVADINAKGGINGEKLVLSESDDACDPKQALMITPISTNPELTDAGYKTVFRVCGRDDAQGVVQANYVLKNYRSYRIGILHDNSTGGRGQAGVFQKTINAVGVKEAVFDSYTPNEKDYSALITRLKGVNGIQLLMIGGYHTDVALIARQIKKQNANIQIIGGDGLVTDEFWKIAGDAAEGVLMSFEPDTRGLPEAQPVVQEFQQAGYDPAGYTLYGYAAVQVIAEGIKKAGYPDPVKVAAVLHKNTFDTVIGKIGFDDKGDVTGSSYVMYRWHDGKYAQVPD